MDVMHAESITVRAGEKTLLHDVSLTLRAGSITALLGPNGAGKSTLLKVFSGSLVPSSGSVRFHGKPLPAWTPRECARKRAVLLQDFHLPFAFTVEDVAGMGRYPHAAYARTAEAGRENDIVRSCLEAADLLPLRRRFYPTLSGGERQRVHWARVLAQLDPATPPRGKCLLLDEPTASLDLAHQHALLARARALALQGVAVLVILHDLNLAARYADTLVLLKTGRVAAAGDPASVMTPPVLRAIYEVDVGVMPHPEDGLPWMYVRAAHAAAATAANRRAPTNAQPSPTTNHPTVPV